MNYTTNFNLNKPEGTDLYNHLTIDNPNMDIIDAAMQANKLASVGNATELVSGTVHAITRSDSTQNIFKFKATGDFKAGDTITVDGVSVNTYTTDGQQLLDDAYVLSAEVLCILDGTNLWILVNKIPNAIEVKYDNNYNVKSKIDNIENVIHISNFQTCMVTNDGSLEISIPIRGDGIYTSVTASKTTNITCAIYGPIKQEADTVDLQASIRFNTVRLKFSPNNHPVSYYGYSLYPNIALELTENIKLTLS